MEQQQVEL